MKVLALAAASALVLGLAACASDRNSSAPASGGASGGSEVKRGAQDAMLTGKVKAALAADVGLRTLDIDVDSRGTTVTLNGAVESETEKRRAEEVARRVEGVAHVQNNLTVKKGG